VSATTEEKPKLIRRQLKAIPFLVSSSTYTQGCEKANINKTTLYKWLKNPEFKAELDRQRSEIVEAAFGMIAQNIEKAVSELVGLLDTKDERVKCLTANDIIRHFLKHKELKDLEERIERIEKRLETSR
jgi:phage terminase small subunit